MVASTVDETAPHVRRQAFPSVSRGLSMSCGDPDTIRIRRPRRLKDLIPQKRVAAELGVSRSSLWRASCSNIAGFPAPTRIAGRVYWRATDLPALKAALDRFPGRKAFEQQRKHAKARAARDEAAASRSKRRKPASPRRQPDLFGEPDVVAPGGGGAVSRRSRSRKEIAAAIRRERPFAKFDISP